jgi:hypothetical protein
MESFIIISILSILSLIRRMEVVAHSKETNPNERPHPTIVRILPFHSCFIHVHACFMVGSILIQCDWQEVVSRDVDVHA